MELKLPGVGQNLVALRARMLLYPFIVSFQMLLSVFLQFELFEALWARKRLYLGVNGHVTFESHLRVARKRTLRAPECLVLLLVLKVLSLITKVRTTELAPP